MELGHVIMDPSAAVAGVAGASLAGLVVWWLVRKRQKRVRLPTIRIMRFESRLLPRLVLRLPPLVPFLCFLVAAAVLLGFSLRPRTQVFTPFEPNQTRIHVFVDMSPSVAAQTSLDDLIRRVGTLYDSLKASGRVTFSTSHDATVFEPASAAELGEALRQRGFHRGGLRLGTALKALIETLGEVDRLFIVSDRDQHSWGGFNWRYLLDEMDVLFYDMTAPTQRPNLFVNDARYLSTPGAPTPLMDWEVEVARRAGGGEAVEGQLEAVYRGKTLATMPWKLAAGKPRLTVRISWPASLVETLVKTDAPLKSGDGDEDEPLVFRSVVDGGDALAMDDEFRTALLGLRQDALVIAETAGERVLEDPTNQLQIALQVLGFRIERHDFVKQPGPDPATFPFWVLVGGAGSGVDRFCPKSIQLARVARQSGPGAPRADGRRAPLPKIWLAPQTLGANYKEMCQCYARLLLTPVGAEAPNYCEHVETRSQWLALLPSLGAKQVGGQVGDGARSIAWHGKDTASGQEVLAFTVPLAPLLATGINHAQMPVLVRELLKWQNILQDSRSGVGRGAWPRIEDVSETLWKPAAAVADQAATAPARMRATNVPLGESLLVEVEAEALPPRWTSQMDWSDKQLPVKKDREDPLPWLKLAALIAVAVTALEALLGLGGRIGRLVLRRPESAPQSLGGGVASGPGGLVLLLAAMLGGGGGFATPAAAKVVFNLVGYNEGPISMATLAREVSHRTSIELEPKPNTFAQMQPETLGEPWLWAHDAAALTTPGGALRGDVQLWLKRGGFLVLEAPLGDAQLGKLTENLAPPADPAAAAKAGDGGWLPLPPDHEMMRSFYLLDALPACNNQIWRGFEYDGRLAILAVPYGFLASLKDRGGPPACANPPDQERSVRIFVNLVMVALATDYKKDQIHLPEILKRLR